MSLGQRQIGPRLRQLGARHGVVQTHQRLPARHGLPFLKSMLWMRPATSGRSTTDSSERRLPTAEMPRAKGTA